MAIDTEAKRRSALNARLLRMGIRRVLPPPSGSVSSDDRPHLAGVYIGIQFVAIALVTYIYLSVTEDRLFLAAADDRIHLAVTGGPFLQEEDDRIQLGEDRGEFLKETT